MHSAKRCCAGEDNENNIECVIICDTSHFFEKEGATTIMVSKGADSVDFALVNMLNAGDIVISKRN